ncbi:MAG: hypothetical protein ACR2RL_02430, partial [Gammaproteobacteria bacterium]
MAVLVLGVAGCGPDSSTSDPAKLGEDEQAQGDRGAFVGTGPPLVPVQGLALDSANNRVLIAGGSALQAVDLATGDRTIVSDAGTGSGPLFAEPAAVVLDIGNNRALVADKAGDPMPPSQGALFAVDLGTGDRTLFSSATVGAGVGFSALEDLVLDGANDRVLAADRIQGVLAVDLDSGDRTLVSAAGQGAGEAFGDVLAIALDTTDNRLLVVDDFANDADAVFAVDPGSGDRIFVSGPTVRPAFGLAAGLALDGANNRALVADSELMAVVAVDLSTGARTVFSDRASGAGPAFGSLLSITLDGDRALVGDLGSAERSPAVYAVDLETGDRTVISDNRVDTTTDVVSPRTVAVDVAGNRALVVDDLLDSVVALDLTTGDATALSDSGAGPALRDPRDSFVDTANNRVVVADRQLGALVGIDVANGARTVVSDATVGAGPALLRLEGVTFASAQNRALAISQANVLAVDLATGDRAIFSDATTGGGEPLSSPVDLAMDAANG